MFKLTLAALLPAIGLAQQISVGAIGGVPAETPLGRSTISLPSVIGPTLTLGFRNSFALQTGILFHRLGRREDIALFNTSSGSGFVNSQLKATAIELPLLLRYHFLSQTRNWQPFVSAGPTIRRTQTSYRSGGFVGSSSFDVTKWKINPSFGTGVSFKAGRIRIEPEVRYSYWGSNRQDTIRQNQVHFLFGLRF